MKVRNMLYLLDTLPIRSCTKRLVECLFWDVALPPAVSVDFGVESPNHYRALRAVVFAPAEPAAEPTPEAVEAALRQRILALDAALGQGTRLNALVRQYAPQYADVVRFETFADVHAGAGTRR
jgi:hypothetical protein